MVFLQSECDNMVNELVKAIEKLSEEDCANILVALKERGII